MTLHLPVDVLPLSYRKPVLRYRPYNAIICVGRGAHCYRISIVEGLPGDLGNKGTLAKYPREQGNISQFLGTGEQNSKNYSTKTF